MLNKACSGFARRATGVMLLGVVALCGCRPLGRSQDVVQGKGFAISRGEFNQALSEVPGGTGAGQAVKDQLLQRLIDEKLLANAAKAESLDQDSAVLQRFEASRRQILANAYIQRLTNDVRSPSNIETVAFYKDNPEVFANRVEVDVDEVLFHGESSAATGLAKQYDSGAPLAEIAARASHQGIAVDARTATLTSDQLPQQVARQLPALKPGVNFIYPMGDGAFYGHLRAIRPAPLSFAEARPIIVDGLTKRAKAVLLEQDIARLRKAANLVADLGSRNTPTKAGGVFN